MPIAERRELQRYRLQLAGTINLDADPPGGEPRSEVITRDISSGGAYLLATACPEVGHRVRLHLDWPRRRAQIAGCGNVLRVDLLFREIHGIALRVEDFPLKVEDFEEIARKSRPLPPLQPAKARRINEPAFRYYHQLQKVKGYSEEYYAERISLEKAARIAAMEATYFSSFFHRKVGIPFHDWLREIRITKAIELMKSEDRSITEIALTVGFEDLRTFQRAFKKCTNLTAREFRRLVAPCPRQVGVCTS